MKVGFVGHACLRIETRGLRFLCDPWWSGSAYVGQWHHWPPAAKEGVESERVDYVYLSHGHEDHLHLETLRALPRGATALVPAFVTGSLAEYLRSEGLFREVIEIGHGETVQLRSGVSATIYINVTDSILVLDDGEELLVNGNDALHAAPAEVREHFSRTIRERHGRPSSLFLGFGGASWAPNCIRMPGKDDRAAARAREEELTRAFVEIVDHLEPEVACAFAASFVLVEPHNRWISELRLELETPDEIYARVGRSPRTRCHHLLPGDRLERGELIRGAAVKPDVAAFRRALEAELADVARAQADLPNLDEEQLFALAAELERAARAHRGRLPALARFEVAIVLRERPDAPLALEVFPSGARVRIGGVSSGVPRLELRAEILRAVLTDDYGSEAIFIGYGAVAVVPDEEGLRRVEEVVMLLGPRQGSWRGVVREVLQRPTATAGRLWRQRWPLGLHAGARLGLLRRGPPAGVARAG